MVHIFGNPSIKKQLCLCEKIETHTKQTLFSIFTDLRSLLKVTPFFSRFLDAYPISRGVGGGGGLGSLIEVTSLILDTFYRSI